MTTLYQDGEKFSRSRHHHYLLHINIFISSTHYQMMVVTRDCLGVKSLNNQGPSDDVDQNERFEDGKSCYPISSVCNNFGRKTVITSL